VTEPRRLAAAGAVACAVVLGGPAGGGAPLGGAAEPPSPVSPDAPDVPGPPTPSGDAPVAAMVSHGSWIRRLVGAMRLERPQAKASAERLTALALDPDPRVRCAAVMGLAVIGAEPSARIGEAEEDPRVLRTMLRCNWPLDAARIERGARALARAPSADSRILAVELVGALDAQGRATPQLRALAVETLTRTVAGMGREESGSMGPRLSAITGAPDPSMPWRWRSWMDRNRGTMRIDGGMIVGPGRRPQPSPVAELEDDRFLRFAEALDALFVRPIDLGIAIDCTASMSAEIAQAQSGIDDLMRFVNGSSAGLRVALVGYRDRGDEFQFRAWDFTADPQEARKRLWTLSAEGGGDEPELVFEALQGAYRDFRWNPAAQRVMVLVGDAPPHPGFGSKTVDLARAAAAAGIVTHVISARDPRRPEEVKHFPEIARAGGGRLIRLDEHASLVAELAGVVLADTWHDHVVAVFERYLLLCR